MAVFGSAYSDPDQPSILMAQKVGDMLAHLDVIVATGGTVGLPSVVVERASAGGTPTVAFFPDPTEEMLLHNKVIHSNDIGGNYTTRYFFNGFTERSLYMIKNARCAIALKGRIGTLSEWSIAVEEALPCIVLRSGGITETIESIIEVANREFSGEEHCIVDTVGELEVALKKLLKHEFRT